MALALGGVLDLGGDAMFCRAGDRTCGARIPLGLDRVGVSLLFDGVLALLFVAIPVDRTLARPDLLVSEAGGWAAEEAEFRFVFVSAIKLVAPFVETSGFCFCISGTACTELVSRFTAKL